MKITKLHIRNFKSLVDFELEDLKPFCAFVGPNASGKSNIFEALEFTNYVIKYKTEAPRFFGGKENIFSYTPNGNKLSFSYEFDDGVNMNFSASLSHDGQNTFGSMASHGSLSAFRINELDQRANYVNERISNGELYNSEYEQFADSFFRIFVGNARLNRIPSINTKLSPDASNLPQIIGMIFEDDSKRNDFIEWLRILIPEFKNIEVKKSNIDGSYDFFIFEKGSDKPFPRQLISDGTYNILSLMAAVYQSNQPQFLCIEEPENGLHPQAIELLVDFFREKCEEEGHHIWLNTHSQTLVRCLEIDEIILVNKIDGATKAKQLTKDDEVDIRTDEAWLSNALGGGVLWSK
ncbi:MAG TPA: AAA family ATPase [Puia sp.]|nr:AAA family ATPase [Puia sp.]